MNSTNAPSFDQLSFEEAYAQLEEIIRQLESGDLPLEDSLTLYERGRVLASFCQSTLDKAELRINQLADDGSSTPL